MASPFDENWNLSDTTELRLQTPVRVIERVVGDATVVTFYNERGYQVGPALVVRDMVQDKAVLPSHSGQHT